VADRALITGGAGFIGSRLASSLVERGVDVTLIDNFFRSTPGPDLEDLLSRVQLVEHDLTRPIPNGALGDGFDQVYHLAAIVGARRSVDAPHEVLRTNLSATINLLDWCRHNPPERLFLSSTSEVMDGAVQVGLVDIPVSEDVPLTIPDVTLPRSSYAVSKVASESLVLNYARMLGFAARIARYHNVYGPRMGHDHVIPQFIDRLLDDEDPFRIYGAYQTRAFCFVDDAVEATLRLMELPQKESLIVNIGNDFEAMEIIDLAHRLFAVAGVSPSIEVHPPPAGSPERRLPNLDRLRELTAYRPRVDLDDGLKTTYEWYRQERSMQAEPVKG
jgi:UDP-glucuronate decarboxylase